MGNKLQYLQCELFNDQECPFCSKIKRCNCFESIRDNAIFLINKFMREIEKEK